eukprot:TRINITY_DN8409_c0_g1_i1.p1 TRINITY_DN8409_c0_g1~~TRINITY_DN8409_c0_g1_i1.p1  ORF type:complete len:890 (+),score=184.52 TRINITY_DN8409_c0_g1_i1:354-3023(+)
MPRIPAQRLSKTCSGLLRRTTPQNRIAQQKSFLDEVLASFMMFHPEHTTTVMAPLVSMMLSGALQYSKKRPPFHALLNLFTALDLGEDADEDELPLDQHSVNVCTDMVFYLSELCTRFNDPPPVAAWLADCLSIEGNYAFTLNYFRWLLKSSTGEHGKDAKAAVLPLPPDHLRALMKSQQRQYGNRNIELAITVVVTQCEQAAPHLQMYGDAIVATFRSTQAAAVTHTHEIFATLLSSPSSKCLLSLFEMLVAALPPPSTWMSLHLLPPLLRALGSGNATASALLEMIFSREACTVLLCSSSSLVAASAPTVLSVQLLEHFAKKLPKEFCQPVAAVWERAWTPREDNPLLCGCKPEKQERHDATMEDDPAAEEGRLRGLWLWWPRLRALLPAWPRLPPEFRHMASHIFEAFVDCIAKGFGCAALQGEIAKLFLNQGSPATVDFFVMWLSRSIAGGADCDYMSQQITRSVLTLHHLDPSAIPAASHIAQRDGCEWLSQAADTASQAQAQSMLELLLCAARTCRRPAEQETFAFLQSMLLQSACAECLQSMVWSSNLPTRLAALDLLVELVPTSHAATGTDSCADMDTGRCSGWIGFWLAPRRQEALVRLLDDRFVGVAEKAQRLLFALAQGSRAIAESAASLVLGRALEGRDIVLDTAQHLVELAPRVIPQAVSLISGCVFSQASTPYTAASDDGADASPLWPLFASGPRRPAPCVRVTHLPSGLSAAALSLLLRIVPLCQSTPYRGCLFALVDEVLRAPAQCADSQARLLQLRLLDACITARQCAAGEMIFDPLEHIGVVLGAYFAPDAPPAQGPPSRKRTATATEAVGPATESPAHLRQLAASLLVRLCAGASSTRAAVLAHARYHLGLRPGCASGELEKLLAEVGAC